MIQIIICDLSTIQLLLQSFLHDHSEVKSIILLEPCLPHDAMRKLDISGRPVSVCLSVRHTRVFYRNCLRYHQTCFLGMLARHSSYLRPFDVTQFQGNFLSGEVRVVSTCDEKKNCDC